MNPIEYKAWFASRREILPVESMELHSNGHVTVETKVCEGGGWYERVRASTHRNTLDRISGKQVPRVVVLQYTGTKDRNGKKIFNRDILFVKTLTHIDGFNKNKEVYFFEGSFYVGGRPLSEIVRYHDVELVGNAFTDPDLLGEY